MIPIKISIDQGIFSEFLEIAKEDLFGGLCSPSTLLIIIIIIIIRFSMFRPIRAMLQTCSYRKSR